MKNDYAGKTVMLIRHQVSTKTMTNFCNGPLKVWPNARASGTPPAWSTVGLTRIFPSGGLAGDWSVDGFPREPLEPCRRIFATFLPTRIDGRTESAHDFVG